MHEADLLKRISVNPKIFGGKPIIRGWRLAPSSTSWDASAGDAPETILEGYAWLEPEDIGESRRWSRLAERGKMV